MSGKAQTHEKQAGRAKQETLESLIGNMVRRLDSIQPCDQGRRADQAMSEIEALIPADPVLADLYKQYCETDQTFKKLQRENGAEDPMAEVAADMRDSARSAIQARLLELQDSGDEQVRATLRCRLRLRQAAEQSAIARALCEKRHKEDKEKSDDLFFWLIMTYWIVSRTFNTARKTLSAAHDFALVAIAHDNRHSSAYG